jgi:hypothetical protein
MCNTCNQLHLSSCPPARTVAEPDHAEHLAQEREIEAALVGVDPERAILDAVAELALRARLC